MANQETPMENGEDFSQDVTANQENGQHNGGGDAPPADSGSADKPGKDDDRKLFVSGLSWETTDKELRDYFGKYGEIESINVKTDFMTGRSRGFAFIVLKEVDSIDKVTAAGEHTINGKKVDPKKAKARHGIIFVGGIPAELSDDDIKEYFGQYGTIIEVEMPFDKQKNQRKGFCFITFESEQVVGELLKRPKQTIKDKEVDIKNATPKRDQMMMVRGGRGGRGGPRGRGEELQDYFGKYGEIESINVKTDFMTGRSRGFAFIVFKEVDSIDKVTAAGEHTNGKKVDPKKAKARHGKIFVGGIPAELSDDDIKEYFGQYGTIIEVEMPFDKQKNQRKGFCFITFESEQVVGELLKRPKQTIKDKEVDIKNATPKRDQMMMVRGGRGGRGGPRGRGGRGGYNQGWGQGYGSYLGYGPGYGYDGYGGQGYDYYGGGYGGYYGGYDYGYGNYGGATGFQGKARGGGRGGNQRHQPY